MISAAPEKWKQVPFHEFYAFVLGHKLHSETDYTFDPPLMVFQKRDSGLHWPESIMCFCRLSGDEQLYGSATSEYFIPASSMQ